MRECRRGKRAAGGAGKKGSGSAPDGTDGEERTARPERPGQLPHSSLRLRDQPRGVPTPLFSEREGGKMFAQRISGRGGREEPTSFQVPRKEEEGKGGLHIFLSPEPLSTFWCCLTCLKRARYSNLLSVDARKANLQRRKGRICFRKLFQVLSTQTFSPILSAVAGLTFCFPCPPFLLPSYSSWPISFLPSWPISFPFPFLSLIVTKRPRNSARHTSFAFICAKWNEHRKQGGMLERGGREWNSFAK